MKWFAMLVLGLCSTAWSQGEVSVVQSVDLVKYQGQFYEIAAIPQIFQRECYRDTRAHYELSEDGTELSVLNQCEKENGEIKEANGVGRPVNDGNSKLEVTFVHFIDWIWALSGDYWILDIHPDYQWSLVGAPDRKSAWILSRTPVLDLETLREIEAELERQGFDTCELLMSRTSEQDFAERPRLCDFTDLKK